MNDMRKLIESVDTANKLSAINEGQDYEILKISPRAGQKLQDATNMSLHPNSRPPFYTTGLKENADGTTTSFKIVKKVKTVYEVDVEDRDSDAKTTATTSLEASSIDELIQLINNHKGT